uniref:Stomatin-like protein 2, mitochondrial n=1 Tax=Ciona savignyi TaxID=51511 RepID=H2YV97_CIOSA
MMGLQHVVSRTIPSVGRASLQHGSVLAHCNKVPRKFEVARCHKIFVRNSSYKTPVNIGFVFVPQQEAWVVERMGKYNSILKPGLNLLIPLLDKVKYVQVLKEQAIKIPEQSAVTKDNVNLHIDGVLYVRVDDPYKASYGIEDPEYAVTQLAQTTMRSEIGKLTLDGIFREREILNTNIVIAINHASEEAWGISCLRYEIRDIQVPTRVQEAMQMQVEAERRKRASILQSEGQKESAINVALGNKEAQILASESEKVERINEAQGEANAILAKAEAKASAIRKVAEALSLQNGQNAASFTVAEQYVNAFSNLAKESNTVLLPSNTGDVSSMVAQAMAIYSKLNKTAQAEDILQEQPNMNYNETIDDINQVDSTEQETDDKNEPR